MAVVTVTAYVLYSSSRRSNKEDTTRQPQKQRDRSDSDHILKALFDQAVQSSTSLQSLTNGDKLMLYGLYKQAMNGDASTTAPSLINMIAHAKHSAWSKFRGMPEATAMFHYIQAVKELGSGEAILDDDSSSRYSMDGPDIGGGMGLKPSMLVDEPEDDEPNSDSLEARLRKAAATDNVLAVKDLVEEGADIDAADDAGQSPLHFCADRGMLDGVVYLLELGANPNAKDNDDISVLQAAVIAGHVEVCRALLEKGADPDSEDSDGDTPRSCAMEDRSEKLHDLFAKYF